MADEYVDANWCPDCGLPRGVCACGEMRASNQFDDWGDDDYEDDDEEGNRQHICLECAGTGESWDGLGTCEYCDGEGYKWWM
jgi:hypothetical protein